METIGWVGGLLLAFCAIPQAIQSYLQKHSNGMSIPFLMMWLIGEVFVFAYVLPKQDYPLLINYAVNILCLIVICWYRFFPAHDCDTDC